MVRDEKISEEDVISKLKDDGDFDRLRVKIVRHLKQNEDLRDRIISAVKESAALNLAGAENMAPRQLCDAIHDEIRENVMKHISDGLWEIIQSPDLMKTEISNTVQSVYSNLQNSQRKPEIDLPSSDHRPLKDVEPNGLAMVSGDSSCTLSEDRHREQSGFSRQNHSNCDDSQSKNQQPGASDGRCLEDRIVLHESNGLPRENDGDKSPPSGLLSNNKPKWDSDGNNEEDPDIPPGFG